MELSSWDRLMSRARCSREGAEGAPIAVNEGSGKDTASDSLFDEVHVVVEASSVGVSEDNIVVDEHGSCIAALVEAEMALLKVRSRKVGGDDGACPKAFGVFVGVVGKGVTEGAGRRNGVDGVVDVSVIAAPPVPMPASFDGDAAPWANLERRGVGMDPKVGPSCAN